MTSNKFYYVVGIAGSGKTTACQQLADAEPNAQAFSSSSKLAEYLPKAGLNSWSEFNALDTETRDKVINKLHLSFAKDKACYSTSFADAHMAVENPVKNEWCNAMPTEHAGITDGVIFLQTPPALIASNIHKDNVHNKRNRQAKDLSELTQLQEREFAQAEDYCLKNKLPLGVIQNSLNNTATIKDIRFLNKHYLPQTKRLRELYKKQFNFDVTGPELRRMHLEIGQLMYHAFMSKAGHLPDSYQVLAIPRSGNMLAVGFTDTFNGPFLWNERNSSEIQGLTSQNLIIIDSVIDTGKTITDTINKLPEGLYGFRGHIHIVCLAINIKALKIIEALSPNIHIHCLGFSNKEDRPKGQKDMGARLFCTSH
ncbi:AAA family ATPase [Reinekea marinisedimentorum]|uniref:Thymidylate kinase n=1 Tax=Reinekea marinisedimentorum TaxID=230495 RepID=A0A4R3IC29_9GAMM|nr:AAA family ATPase [Reinekea marinisedimentorum]TCS43106.1 thymidylate kinase [Reinekea marinisedimentorum]